MYLAIQNCTRNWSYIRDLNFRLEQDLESKDATLEELQNCLDHTREQLDLQMRTENTVRELRTDLERTRKQSEVQKERIAKLSDADRANKVFILEVIV